VVGVLTTLYIPWGLTAYPWRFRFADMVIFGVINVAILLVVMAVKRYAFTSLWCAYAAVASVIILTYFWKSHGERPFRYAESM
jgi:hypothetical protein